MMLIHDASGAVVVVSAESVRIVGEGCIVLNARAVYIHNQALTSEQAAIVKRGVTATLDDPAALEDLHGKHDVASVDLSRTWFRRSLFFLPSLFERFGLCDYKPIAAEEGA